MNYIMNYSLYPINDSDFYNTGNKIISNKPFNECLDKQRNPPKKCKNSVTFGYSKPLNEICREVHYNINNKDPKKICTDSPWNNMTKRKTLVKDY